MWFILAMSICNSFPDVCRTNMAAWIESCTQLYINHIFSLIGHPIWRGRYTVWTLTISKRSNKVIESWSIVTLSYLNVRRSCKCSLWGFSSSEKHSTLYCVLYLPEVTSTEVKLIASVVLILSLLSVPCF